MKFRLPFVLAIVCAFMLGGVAPAMSDDTQPQGHAPTAKVPDMPASIDQSGRPQQAPQSKAARPASAASKTNQAMAEQGGIQIQDPVVCQNVVNREPVGSGDVFPKEISKVFCYFRVVGVTGESSITTNWYYKGTLKASVQLAVRSPNWRTWTSKSMSPEWTGEWMVEFLSSEGSPLGNVVFVVQ